MWPLWHIGARTGRGGQDRHIVLDLDVRDAIIARRPEESIAARGEEEGECVTVC